MILTFIHTFKNGIVAEMKLGGDPPSMDVCWSKDPPFTKKQQREIQKEYFPWRDACFEEYARQSGEKILVVTL